MKPSGMKLHDYPDRQPVYIALRSVPGADLREAADGLNGLNVDIDAAGNVVGFDIDHASQRLDLSTLETVALPVKTTRAA